MCLSGEYAYDVPLLQSLQQLHVLSNEFIFEEVYALKNCV